MLESIISKKYPNLTNRLYVTADEHSVTIEIPFSNKRYKAWISKDEQGYLTGINELHSHYDLGTPEQNLKDALEEFDEILTNKIAVVGLRNESSKFLIATLELEDALTSYLHEKPSVEIVTFSTEH